MTENGVVLCYPPVTRMYQPYLGLAVLGAVLQEENIPVHVLDLNLEVWETVWSPEFMVFCAEHTQREDVRSVILDLSQDVDWAKNVLRSPVIIEDERKYLEAMTILDAVNASLSAACPSALFGFHMVAPREPKGSPEQIDRLVDDPQRNPFVELAQFMQWDKLILRYEPTVLGITVLAESQLLPAVTLCSYLRSKGFKGHIVLGGPYVSRYVSFLMAWPTIGRLVDSLVCGEGAEPLLALWAYASGKGQDRGIPGVFWPGQGIMPTITSMGSAQFSGPTPDFSLFPLQRYFTPKLRIPLVMSKHCPWGRCAYCDVTSIRDCGRFMYRNPEIVVADIAAITRTTGAQIYHFVDDCMVLRLAKNFAQLLLADQCRIKWACALRPSSMITRDMAELLFKSGLRSVFMGIESASNAVLQRMHRGVTIEQVTGCLQNLASAGIKVHGAVMFGFPGESEDDARLTQHWVMKHQDLFHRLDVNLFTLTPYSKVYQRPDDFGVEINQEARNPLSYAVPFTVNGSDERRKMAVRFVTAMRTWASTTGKMATLKRTMEAFS